MEGIKIIKKVTIKVTRPQKAHILAKISLAIFIFYFMGLIISNQWVDALL